MADDLLEYIREAVDRIESKQDKHDERLRTVEAWQSDAKGRMSMLGAVGAALGGTVVAAIEYLRGHQ